MPECCPFSRSKESRGQLTLEKELACYGVKKEPKTTDDNRARLRVAGVGLVTILTTPALSQHSFFWIPVIVVSSFVFSPPLAWVIAPMMMQRFIQARNMR